jgi:hypothetical protein
MSSELLPTFWHKESNKNTVMSIYNDNLGDYRGSKPRLSRDKILVAPQPHGNKLTIHQQIRTCQHMESVTKCDAETLNPPFCHEHTKQTLRLQIKKSTIDGAGDGLFAYNPKGGCVFKKYDYIASFHGEILTHEEFRERYGAKYDESDEKWFTPYSAQAGDKIIDAIIVRGIMAMANDCREEWRTNVTEKYDPDLPNQIKCYANRDIYHDDELFIKYGIAWWIAFPHEYIENLK